jgi:hypothetical protein
MIKIKLYELDKHRNETTFRPYLMAQNVLRDVGIEFTRGDSYDYAWVGQASITNKKIPLEQSTHKGLEFLSKIKGDYMLVDGQDSTSLIGSYDVFKESNAMLLLKNSLLKHTELYDSPSVTGWVNGRYYWGQGNYKAVEFDKYKDRIKLSGTNWLSTMPKPTWHDNIPKTYDVSALFSYPSAPGNIEYDIENNIPYDNHRKPCIDVVNKLTCNVAKLENGIKLPQQEYYNRMACSKIVLAPLGYGAMAPRDIEAIAFGSILIKPYMDYIDSNPMWYEEDKTYIPCRHDYTDLEEKINYVLDNYTELQQTMIPYARKKFDDLYTLENTAINTYNIFSNLNNTTSE